MSVMTPPGIKNPGDYIEDVMSTVKAKNAAEPEFILTRAAFFLPRVSLSLRASLPYSF